MIRWGVANDTMYFTTALIGIDMVIAAGIVKYES